MVVKFSEEQRLNAVKLYQEGNSISEIESITGISTSYVKNLLKKHNVQTRPSGFQPGNSLRYEVPHLIETKIKISENHKVSGHKPSKEAIAKGQPLSLKATWKNHIKDPVGQLIRIYKQGAVKRSLVFSLTREEFETIIGKSCYYCGTAPSLRNVNGCDLVCNGIDRKDSSFGYYQENCLPCCKICNVMKSTMTCNDFILHCVKISKGFTHVS